MGRNFGNYKVEWKVRLGWQQRKLAVNGKSKNSRGGRPIDGFQVPIRRWRQRAEPETKKEIARKRHTRHMETENEETERRKAKDGTGKEIINTGVLEYNIREMLTDERRYENEKQRNRQDKNWEFDRWCTQHERNKWHQIGEIKRAPVRKLEKYWKS